MSDRGRDTDTDAIVAAAREWFVQDQQMETELSGDTTEAAWQFALAIERWQAANERLRAVMRLDAAKTAEAAR